MCQYCVQWNLADPKSLGPEGVGQNLFEVCLGFKMLVFQVC